MHNKDGFLGGAWFLKQTRRGRTAGFGGCDEVPQLLAGSKHISVMGILSRFASRTSSRRTGSVNPTSSIKFLSGEARRHCASPAPKAESRDGLRTRMSRKEERR
jgi:hypothetical protein